MAYTTAQTAAQVVTAVQTATGTIYAPATDAINNMLSGLAGAVAPNPPIGTPVLYAGVLIKCTSGFSSGTPVYAYDASPA